MKNLLLCLAQITCVILFFSSCEDKVIIPQDISTSGISHVIAPETAIQSMCEFLGDMEFKYDTFLGFIEYDDIRC